MCMALEWSRFSPVWYEDLIGRHLIILNRSGSYAFISSGLYSNSMTSLERANDSAFDAQRTAVYRTIFREKYRSISNLIDLRKTLDQ